MKKNFRALRFSKYFIKFVFLFNKTDGMVRINTRKALSPAYRKHKPLRKDVDAFTHELLACLKAVKDIEQRNEREEHIKEPLKVFFHNTFYKKNYINTKDNIDLAIYRGEDLHSDVAVIIETKKPSNKTEFLLNDNLNRKALHELLLYYLRQRVDEQNNNIKHLIATNGYEWYLFKSEDFYNYFYKNKRLIKEYEDFRDGKKDSSKNELFYQEIAKKYIAEVEHDLPFVYLDFTKKSITEYPDSALNTLYKIFSDVHWLGASFGNDSNQLNRSFYNELLHIIGLEEVNEKNKKLIQRKDEKRRDYGSILENTIFTLEDRDYLSQIKSIESGKDKAFNAGLALTLTWINRILFLKLLESQLLTYHNNAKEYSFLNSDFIKGFDDLNDLFFSALAKKPEERHPKYKARFQNIPYLNSSLFERTTTENEAFTISSLNDETIEVFSQTVLKNANGKRLKGKLNTLDYLFKFLDAYNFAADGTEGIEDEKESKSLINASVLGLIFEKINGYKEGSFYTPAYITMYMSGETIRRTVVQKFKEQENQQIETFDDLKAYTHRFFKPNDLKRFNKIINAIRIIDPAVGSGHFLVSALNELIHIKSELNILIDENGNALRSEIIIENDELYVTDEHGHLLDYKPDVKETALIQKTLFHEKQNIIENSLFGVDINPNSVNICRLRLWIELLKNAYYTEENQLQTLPNIDINIKTGNSLISRFNLHDDLRDAFKGKEVKHSFTDYKNAVAEYKNTNDKARKHEILQIINEVKHNFKSTLDNSFILKVQKAQGAYSDEKNRLENLRLFGEKIKKAEKDRLKTLKQKAELALAQKEEIVNNAIYHNAFEWRFEFPEVLDDNGNYIGFDIVIGNPPYVQLQTMGETSNALAKMGYETFHKGADLYCLFAERGYKLLKNKGLQSFIMPNKWMITSYGKPLRRFLSETRLQQVLNFGDIQFFDEATTYVCIFVLQQGSPDKTTEVLSLNQKTYKGHFIAEVNAGLYQYPVTKFGQGNWSIQPQADAQTLQQMEKKGTPLKNLPLKIYRGILTGYNDAFYIDAATKNKLIAADPRSAELIKPMVRGRDISAFGITGFEYLICTFPSLNLDIDDYPAIKEHLLNFGFHRLKQTGERGSRKKTGGEWFETQDSIAYHKEFSKPKIMYPNMTSAFPFLYDESGLFSNDKSFILTATNESVSLLFLTALFNSSLAKLWIWYNCPELQGGTREIRKVYFEQFPVPFATHQQRQTLEQLAKNRAKATQALQTLTTDFQHKLQHTFQQKTLAKKLREWSLLSYTDFVKELHKMKLSLTPEQEAEWQEYFEQQKAEAQKLRMQIDNTDREIDQMVYVLYDLTQE